MESYLGTNDLISKDGTIKPKDALTDVKLVAIYFSMHHCPPCRQFTPLLTTVYEEVNADSKVLEVIFCSFDKNLDAFKSYYNEMPWLALPFQG